MGNKDELKAVVYNRVGSRSQLEDSKQEEFTNCNGVPGGISMYEIYSMFEEYDEIAMTAMELVLTEGPDALMYQLNYDDIEQVKKFPTICKRAIELGILTAEEVGDLEEDEE